MDSSGECDPPGATEMFFFPDEDQANKLSSSPMDTPPTPVRQRGTSSSPAHESVSSSTVSDADESSADDEFCIIDDPGLGIAVSAIVLKIIMEGLICF